MDNVNPIIEWTELTCETLAGSLASKGKCTELERAICRRSHKSKHTSVYAFYEFSVLARPFLGHHILLEM
jgi:hypothetical protein